LLSKRIKLLIITSPYVVLFFNKNTKT